MQTDASVKEVIVQPSQPLLWFSGSASCLFHSQQNWFQNTTGLNRLYQDHLEKLETKQEYGLGATSIPPSCHSLQDISERMSPRLKFSQLDVWIPRIFVQDSSTCIRVGQDHIRSRIAIFYKCDSACSIHVSSKFPIAFWPTVGAHYWAPDSSAANLETCW